MSKTSKRKSGSESSKNSKSLSLKDSHKRPSVFERLGTKASNISVGSLSVNVSNQLDFCRAWAQNGTCPFGKLCKLSYSHTLISPSKRSVKKEDLDKRVQNNLVRRGSPSDICVDWESWDQNELEYEDEKALERRRQLLQRELELQMKKETQKQETSKRRSSSTSSDSSSTSSSSTSSGSSSDSSLSTKKKIEPKIQSPSLLERSIIIKKTMGKGVHKESPPRRSSTSRKLSPQRKNSRRKSISPARKQISPPKSKPSSLNRSSERSSRRNDSPSRRSPERKQSSNRSSGTSRRSPRSSTQRSRARSPRPRPPSRNRTPDRRKEDDRRKDDSRRNDRKSDFRDKREKERVEALERCRERQREREALRERERKERERERKERDKRRRSEGFSNTSSSRRTPPREEKRHERKVERERSYSRERARDRALERVMERRGSSRERSYERPYTQNSPSYRGGNERNRYGSERVSSERGSTREERRGRRWVENREKQSGSREWSEHADWESRSRCEERGDEWCGYAGPGNSNEWRSRSHLSHHDDRRSHHTDKEKDHSSELPKEKETKDLSSHSKRGGEEIELEVPKRPKIDENLLQEELSDISDDPDDILNREDEVFTDVATEEAGDSSLHESNAQPHAQEENARPPTPTADRSIEPPPPEDDAIVSLDFEEISDEELEEESKSNKGVSVVDALGVDWASLVAEWRPPRVTVNKGSARANWSTEAVFRRIGISAELAGEQLLSRITKTYLSDEKNAEDAKAKCLPSTLLQNKQALSARTDIIIRRQLCGLPVISSETHPTTGLCQWAV